MRKHADHGLGITNIPRGHVLIKGRRIEKHAVKRHHLIDNEMIQGLIEHAGIGKHVTHIDGTRRVPVGQGFIEGVVIGKGVGKIGDLADTPIANGGSVRSNRSGIVAVGDRQRQVVINGRQQFRPIVKTLVR